MGGIDHEGEEHRRCSCLKRRETENKESEYSHGEKKDQVGGAMGREPRRRPHPLPPPSSPLPDTDVLRASLSHMGLIQVE